MENTLTQLEEQQQATYSVALQGRIASTRAEFNSLLRRRTEFLMHITRRTYLRLKKHEKY